MDPAAATEISPSTQFLLDEMRRMFAERNAKWDRRFAEMDAARDAQQRDAAVELRVSAFEQDGAPHDAVQEVASTLPRESKSSCLGSVLKPDLACPAQFADNAVPSACTNTKQIDSGCRGLPSSEGGPAEEAWPRVAVEEQLLVANPAAAGKSALHAAAASYIFTAPPDCDCLSLLPDALLRNIVSRLPLKDAARTVVLSRRWRPLCAAPPESLERSDPICVDSTAVELFRTATQDGKFIVKCEKVQIEEVRFEPDAIRGRGPRHRQRRRPPRLLIRGLRPRLRARALLSQPGAVRRRVRVLPHRLRGRARGRRGLRRRRRPPRLLVRGRRPQLRARALLPQTGAVHHPVRAPPRRRPESGSAHLDAPLDRAVGLVVQVLAAAAATHSDAVGIAGGGLLAWIMAAGSVQTNCSTVCSTGGTDVLLVSLLTAAPATSSTTTIPATAPATLNDQRYITNLTSASRIGVVLSGISATKSVGDHTEFEGMSAHITVLLEPLPVIEMSRHAHLHLWPPAEAMLLCWNVEHTCCNWELSVHKVNSYLAHCLLNLGKCILFLERISPLQKVHYCFALTNNLKVNLYLSSSLLSLVNCSSGHAFLLTVGTASYLLRPSDNAHSSTFKEKAQWPFVILALFGLPQKQLWPPQAPSDSCAYIQDTKCMRVIFLGQQCLIYIDLSAAWDGTDSIQFCLDIAIVQLWLEFLQKNWQCVVCLEVALINVLGYYCQAGCLFTDLVLFMFLYRMLLGYYASRELGTNAAIVFCTFPSTIANAALRHDYIDRQHVVLGSSDVGDYPCDMLLKHPWPPPMLVRLTRAGIVLWPMQWPSCCCGTDKKSKLLLFRDDQLYGHTYGWLVFFLVFQLMCKGKEHWRFKQDLFPQSLAFDSSLTGVLHSLLYTFELLCSNHEDAGSFCGMLNTTEMQLGSIHATIRMLVDYDILEARIARRLLRTRLDCFLCCIELQPWPSPATLPTTTARELFETISSGNKLSALDSVTLAVSDLIELGYDELQFDQCKNHDVRYTDSKTYSWDWKIQKGSSDNPAWCHGGLVFSIKALQVPWDPGGSEMSPSAWGQAETQEGRNVRITARWGRHGQAGDGLPVRYKRQPRIGGEGIEEIIRIIPSSSTVHLPQDHFSCT